MRVLMVGAGAVGQVYGLHLQRGGAQVSFYVKPEYAGAARRGFTLFPLNGAVPGRTVRFEGFGVLTTPDEVAAQRWDQIWLAVSSPALRGDWLPRLLQAAGEGTLVMLQAGLDDRQRLLHHWPGERLVTGLISLIAYQAPLPGEVRFAESGIAFWFPPMAPSPFSGARAAQAIAPLKAGGFPAQKTEQVHRSAAWPSAALNTHVAALESVGWSFEAARQGDTLPLAARAAQQAMAIAAHTLGRPRAPWSWRLGVRPSTARLLMILAPRFIPLDIETYLEVHFTKVGDQTRQHLQSFIEHGKAAGLQVGELVEMARRVDAARARKASS